MKHVVIGGCGFTGRLLANHLASEGHEVVVADTQSPTNDLTTRLRFLPVDVCRLETLKVLEVHPEDVVYHLAARQYHLTVPKRGRTEFFDEVNAFGTGNVLRYLNDRGCSYLVYFSTDMVYGYPQKLPIPTTHVRNPLGPYGQSKLKAEQLCESYRQYGMRITILRPRLIIGPGRFGVLTKLFRLIQAGLPVPLIGDGSNCYQMISVRDCVSAVQCAIRRGLPSETYNLGSKNPPSVRDLLEHLIKHVRSRSRLVVTPSLAVKAVLGILDYCGLTLLYKEQFAIADQNYLVDISKTERELGWMPVDSDYDMLLQAYEEFLRVSH